MLTYGNEKLRATQEYTNERGGVFPSRGASCASAVSNAAKAGASIMLEGLFLYFISSLEQRHRGPVGKGHRKSVIQTELRDPVFGGRSGLQ